MAAMVQTFPQQTGTVTMLQARPSSSSGNMHGHSQSQSFQGQQYLAGQQSNRNSFHGLPAVVGPQTAYRGSSTTPVQPYAFAATPAMANGGQWQSYGTYRTSSNPNVPPMQMMDPNSVARPRYHKNASMTNVPTTANTNGGMVQGGSRDDLSLPTVNQTSNPSAPRPQSTNLTVATGRTFAQVAATKPSPERYRRPSPRHSESSISQQQSAQQQGQQQGSAGPSGSGMATVVHLYNPRAAGNQRIPRNSATLASRPHSEYGLIPGMAADDMMVPRQPTESELKRFRRRSMHSFDASEYPSPLTPQELKQQHQRAQEFDSDKGQQATGRAGLPSQVNSAVEKPAASHTRHGSSDSVSSTKSSNSRKSSSAHRSPNVSAPTTTSPASSNTSEEKSSNTDASKSVNVPPRSSSSDAAKRVHNPSPLSKPVNMEPTSSPDDKAAPPAKGNASGASTPTRAPGSSHGTHADSPAAKHLAALNEKGARPKSKSSRLRRAFSFGSAAEFKNAGKEKEPAGSDKATTANNGPSKLQKENPEALDPYEAEQARIAKKQEESGLGNSIYSGTKIFTGSTDNLSISSTASSASVMLRKMGRGVKKGSRSVAGLFRPKSIIGSRSEEASALGGSQPEISMITVEAERERVNVNANGDLGAPSGGTGFPKLERNSIDAIDAAHPPDSTKSDRLDSAGQDSARKSIVGGETDRAEVLATIRKGILKTRSDSPSPQPRPAAAEGKSPAFELPMIPNVSGSPLSSAPSTPNEDSKRANAIAVGNEDYFMSALRLRQDSKSAPGTPQESLGKRNATFSPRIVFYDTWPSQEYDRRGEIATCNRLTPMLAQQIKEELNSFKMEMEVHETSKIYTHFF